MGWEQSAGENVPAAEGIGYRLLERHGAGAMGVYRLKLAAIVAEGGKGRHKACPYGNVMGEAGGKFSGL